MAYFQRLMFVFFKIASSKLTLFFSFLINAIRLYFVGWKKYDAALDLAHAVSVNMMDLSKCGVGIIESSQISLD